MTQHGLGRAVGGFVEPIQRGGRVNVLLTGWLAVGVLGSLAATPAWAVAPSFNGGVTTLQVLPYPAVTDLRDQLMVSDSDAGQTITWTVTTPPGQGTVAGSGATLFTNCSGTPLVCAVSPGSKTIRSDTPITYAPNNGATGSDTVTVSASDGTTTVSRTLTLQILPAPGAGSTVTAADSTALQAALDNPGVAVINLVNGVTYHAHGVEISRPLRITGNGATLVADYGVGQGADNQTLYHLGMPDAQGNRRLRGNLFLLVKNGGSLVVENLTLQNGATTANAQGITGIFGALFVKGTGNLSVDGVSFRDFWYIDSDYLNQNVLAASQDIHQSSYTDTSFGVYADYDAQGIVVVRNSLFDSSNAFRDGIHLYNGGTITLTGNTLQGTAHQARLRAYDGYENGIYLYGGQSTVTGNVLTNHAASAVVGNYLSTGISVIGFHPGVSATITGNTITGAATGATLAGGWQSAYPGSTFTLNGYSLITDPGLAAFDFHNNNSISGTVPGNLDISAVVDQNDTTYGVADPMLRFVSKASATSVTLGLPTAPLNPALNSTQLAVQQSPDGHTWSAATTTPAAPFGVATGTFTVTGLTAGTTYYFRLQDSDAGSSYTGKSNLIGVPGLQSTAVSASTADLSFPALRTSQYVIEQSTNGGSTWSTATLQAALTPTSTAATVTGLSANTAYSFRIRGTGNSLWGSSDSLALTTYPSPVFSGPMQGGGTLQATVSGGGATCGFTGTQLLPPPAGSQFSYNLFSFTLSGCPAQASVNLSLVYPATVDPAAVVLVRRPATNTWQATNAGIAGQTVSLSLTDNGPEDANATAGVLAAQVGIMGAQGVQPVAPVPLLPWPWLAALSLSLAAGVSRRRKAKA